MLGKRPPSNAITLELDASFDFQPIMYLVHLFFLILTY